MMDIALPSEPVSTQNSAFLVMVHEHLAKSEVLVVMIRYANHGGAKDYRVIQTMEEFDTLIKKLAFKTSITVFFESAFAIKGRVNNELQKKVDELFTREYDEYEGLDIICLEPQKGNDGERNIWFMQELESIKEWLRQHKDCQVLIGTMKFWQDNSQDVTTAYVPDVDGQVRPGTY
ncbi:MAG: hypothetical protein KG029_10970 [Bacteroidetes bacterium]|nr:hypothetical protein [Bacteroidota bacterium]